MRTSRARLRALIRGSLFAGVAIAAHSSSMRKTSVRMAAVTSISATRRPCEKDERTPGEADVRDGQCPGDRPNPDAHTVAGWGHRPRANPGGPASLKLSDVGYQRSHPCPQPHGERWSILATGDSAAACR